MTFRDTFREINESITTDFVRSWSTGIWFVIPFALTGFVAEIGFKVNFHNAILGASLVATSAVLLRAALFPRLQRDAVAYAHNNAIHDPDNEARRKTDYAQAEIGRQAVRDLAEVLHDPDSDVRRTAAYAFGKTGPCAVQALTEALRGQESEVRYAAVYSLGHVGPEAVPALTDGLHDPDVNVRYAAAYSLGHAGPNAVPALVDALLDTDGNVRCAAAEAFGEIAIYEAAAVHALVSALHDPESQSAPGCRPCTWTDRAKRLRRHSSVNRYSPRP